MAYTLQPSFGKVGLSVGIMLSGSTSPLTRTGVRVASGDGERRGDAAACVKELHDFTRRVRYIFFFLLLQQCVCVEEDLSEEAGS